MNKKVLSLIILFFSLITFVQAQTDGKITIKGTVSDGNTGEPVPFANLGVLGTVAGVASDMDGNFELVLPDKYADKVIRVSVVGYTTYDVKVADVQGREDVKIVLSPVSYSIAEVDVFAESLVYKKMLRTAAENISRNYISRPYNYQGYFEYTVLNNDAVESSKEAIVAIYDAKGYKRSDVETAFKELNYRFSQVRRDREVKSVFDGLNYFDDIITADIVRNTRNVLDIANGRDYKLKNKGCILFEGDSVQIIAYEAEKPVPSLTGDASVLTYSGEIYINLKDYAVIKNVANVTAKDFNILSRNLIAVNGSKKDNVKMTMITNYKKLDQVYFLSGINILYSYKEGGNNIEGKMQYVTTRVNMDTPEKISGRMYYEDIKTDKKFWDNYSVYFEK